MDWKEEPATQQQLLRLQEYGFTPTFPLTVTQAARLIRQYKHPRPVATAPPPAPAPSQIPAPIVRPLPREMPRRQPAPVSSAPERVAPVAGGSITDNARRYALQLRLVVETAELGLAENPNRPGGRADVHSAISARQRFWLDTCREGFDLQAACPEAIEFHDCYGARYFPPTWDEVAEVLTALDGAMPGWDNDHPELFYETLKLNFPSLLRHK